MLVRTNGAALEIVNDASTASPAGIALRDKDLNAVAANRLSLGGWAYQPVTAGDRQLGTAAGSGGDVIVRAGAQLRAPEVLLIVDQAKSIVVERGAAINTLGMGAAPMTRARATGSAAREETTASWPSPMAGWISAMGWARNPAASSLAPARRQPAQARPSFTPMARWSLAATIWCCTTPCAMAPATWWWPPAA
ncbi:hypothetical protein WJ967_20665 [Achromobacter xylosoxidans]